VLREALRELHPLPDAPHISGAAKKVRLSEHYTGEDYDLLDELADGYPWGFSEEALVSMSWEFASMFSGYFTLVRLEAEVLPVLYIEHSEEGPYLLAATEKRDADLEVLHLLFRRNGEDLGTGMFGSAATSITFSFDSTWEFKLALIRAAFDHADVWESLTDQHPEVWDSGYEDPPGLDSLDPDLRQHAEQRFFEVTGETPARTSTQGRIQSGRIQGYVYGYARAEEERIVGHEFEGCPDRPEAENRELMLRRYVAKVSGLWNPSRRG